MFAACIFVLNMQAQQRTPVTHILTPNASELCKYGNIPMDYHTGHANVSIPLYSTSIRNVDLNIQLSYDSGAIPMNALPSWTGHGWTLHAGGVISRITIGDPDEQNPFYVVRPEGYSPLYNKNYFHNYDTVVNLMNNNNMSLSEIISSTLIPSDIGPDIFYFNFLGKSGRFLLGNDGQWKVISDENLDIEFDISDSRNYIDPFITQLTFDVNQPKTIKGFTIVDEDGVRYNFGGSTSSIEYSVDIFNTAIDNFGKPLEKRITNPWIATSWYLTSVVDRHGETLYSFSYKRGKFIAQIHNTETVTGQAGTNFRYSGTLSAPVYLENINTRDSTLVTFRSMHNTNLTPSIIYGQFYNNDSLLFTQKYSNSEKSNIRKYCEYLQSDSYSQYQYGGPSGRHPLSTVSLQMLSGIDIISKYPSVDLIDKTSYIFQYNFDYRMHISAIKIKAGANEDIASYHFTYKEGDSTYPDYLTTNTDKCGYYNNVDYKQHNYQRGNPDIVRTQYGLLTKIEYPTGGKTEFEYEQNRVTDSAPSYGTRIKSIKDFTSDTEIATERRFSYSNENGIILPDDETAEYAPEDNSYSNIASYIPKYTSFSPNVGYTSVSEELSDNTKITYKYYNSHAVPDPQNDTAYDPLRYTYMKNGKLRMVEITKDGTLYERVSHTYRKDNIYNNVVYAGLSSSIYSNPNSTPSSIITNAIYKLYYDKYDICKTVRECNNGNGMVVDMVSYGKKDFKIQRAYPYRHEALVRKCISQTTSRVDEERKDVFSYPCQYASAPITSNTPASMCSVHFYNPVLSTTTYMNSAIVSKDSTFYDIDGARIFPSCEVRYLGGSSAGNTTIRYNSFSPSGQLLKYTETGKAETQLVWDERDKLVARVTSPDLYLGVTYQEANGTNSCGLTNVYLGGTDVFSLPLVDAEIYTYNRRGQVSSIQSRNGNIVYYQYDYLGRLTEMLDRNFNIIKKYSYNYINKSF